MAQQEKEPVCYISEYITSRTYNVFLNKPIGSPSEYNQLFDLLGGASPNDEFRFNINCPGGDLHTGAQLITSMRTSNAHIITSLGNSAHSLAPLILFAGDEIIIHKNSIMMFHDYSTGEQGKGNELLKSLTAYNAFYRSLLQSYANPFLTETEIDEIVDGRDVFFLDDEIERRMKIFIADREQQKEELVVNFEDSSPKKPEESDQPNKHQVPRMTQMELDFA